MRAAAFVLVAVLTLLAAGTDAADPAPKVVVTSPRVTDVTLTQNYAGRIRARLHVEVRSLMTGYVEEVPVREGQAVKKGDVLFRILPTLYRAKLDAELAEVRIARIELDGVKQQFDQKAVPQQKVALAEARLALAQARAKQAEAELGFTTVRAPFDGSIGRLHQQVGSLVDNKDLFTTLSDNEVLWVYFNVPERQYLEYRRGAGKTPDGSRFQFPDSRIELVLADGSTFDQPGGNTVTVEGDINFETGNVLFRADFPNPDRLLRDGQTGTIAVRRTVKNATVIPQRATFESLDRRYVYVVGQDDVVHRREVTVGHEVGDTFVVKKGLGADDRIVLEGLQHLRDGDKVQYEFRRPEDAAGGPKPGGEK